MKNKSLENVKSFWNRNPCMDWHSVEDYGLKKYFDDAKDIRYKYHYHILRDIEKLHTMKPKSKILEIGVGIGVDTEHLCEKGFQVSGIDLTPKAVKITRNRLKFYGHSADINEGNAQDLLFDDNSFDCIYSFGVLHHSPDTEKTIKEVYRVLKEDGIALIMLYNKFSLNYAVHRILDIPFDGSKDDRCPVERAYSKGDTLKMFEDFSKVNIKTDYLFGTGWGVANNFIPLFLKKPLGKIMGWHNMIWATK